MLLWHHFIFLLSLLTEVPGSGPLKDGLNGEKAGCRITRIVSGLDLNLRRFSPEKVARNFICWSFATSYVPLQKCGHRIFIPGLVFSSIVNLHNSNWSRWSYQGTISLPTKSPPNRTRKVIVPPVMAKSCRRVRDVSPSVCPKTAFLVKFQTSLLWYSKTR